MIEFIYSLGGFVLAVGILVAVHEYGHFWVARNLGVKVLRYSIGFGKPLWIRRAGPDNTEYVIAAIPLGGYVKMLDEDEGEVAPEEVHRAFNRQALWRRTAIVLAGPLANFLFAFVAYWIVFVAGVDGVKPVVGKVMQQSIAERGGFQAGDEILRIDGRPNRSWNEHRLYLFNQAFRGRRVQAEVRTADGNIARRELDLRQLPLSAIDAGLVERGIGLIGYIPPIPPMVGKVHEGKPAQVAGLQVGDRILRVNGKAVNSWRELVDQVQPNPGKTLELDVQRGDRQLVVQVVPEQVDNRGRAVGLIGIEPQPPPLPEDMRVTVRYGPIQSIGRSLESVWIMSALTVKMLVKIVQLEVSAKNISGPLTIAQIAGHTVRTSFERFVMFLAVVSISLGIINLLPIPVLDGGHLLYYAVEAVTGWPVSKQVMLWGQQIGIFLLFALMGLAFYNDIVRLLQ